MKIAILPKLWDDHFIRSGLGIKETSKEMVKSVEYYFAKLCTWLKNENTKSN